MQKLLTPEEIATRSGTADATLRLPAADLFTRRAARLRSLAESHPMADFLLFAARLAEAQHDQLSALPPLPPGDAAHLARCRRHGMPPLDAYAAELPPSWADDLLHRLVTAVVPHGPHSLQNAAAELLDMAPARLDGLARAILRDEEDFSNPLELALAPLIGASLQVLWTAKALALQPSDLAAGFEGASCPACGSPPLASVLHIGEAGHAVRYACCSLCATEWHVTRIKCVSCQNTRDIAYLGLENAAGAAHPAVKAETCPACHSGLKIVSRETDAQADPCADDLATLALDILVEEAGFQRAGRNLFLFTGHA